MKTACPTCGAPVEFRYDDTFVRVCDYCKTGLTRTDRALDSLGKVSDLAETASPLALTTRGAYRGAAFTVVGRVELRHARGGTWHEWYARFDDGRWGWLAEAQGRFYLTFRRDRPRELPDRKQCKVGTVVTVNDGSGPCAFTVAERASAVRVSAEGEIPYAFTPGETLWFADLGSRHDFATIDFGSKSGEGPLVLYVGEQVSLASLDLRTSSGEPARAPEIRSRRLSCPKCGGSIELRVPNASIRLVCEYCQSLLDTESESLAVLADLVDGTGRSPIPLGTTCRFEGVELTLVGYVRREITLVGFDYPFDEFLLYAPELGFRWLVESDGHYSYIRPIAPGLVAEGPEPRYDGVNFRPFSSGRTEVKRVLGEFYWRVEVGERTQMRDYVAPPALLSFEGNRHERNWSLGTYLTRAEIRAAFSVPLELAPATGIAPNQPGFASLDRFVLTAVGAVVGLVLLFGLLAVFASDRTVLKQRIDWASAAASAAALSPGTPVDQTVWFSEPFELKANQNVEFRFETPVDNSWQWVAADLVDVARGDFVTVESDIEYYHGVTEGERWREGAHTATALVAARRAGSHVLRLETQAPAGTSPGPVTVEVVQDVVPDRHLLWAFIALVVPIALFGAYAFRFESRRWENSTFAASSLAQDDE